MVGGIASIAPKDAPDLRDKVPDRGAPPPAGVEEDPTLPPGCPVQALGRLGTASYYLDEMGQLVRQGTKDWNDVGVLTLFGRRADWLERTWPRYGKPHKDKMTGETFYPVVGFDYAMVKKALIQAASFAGIFDPQGRVRGPGAHRGVDGELIMHCGDAVMIGGATRINGAPLPEIWHQPGLVDGFVYPTAPALQRPDVDPVGDDPGRMILRVLKTWNWRRPLLDPILMLGQIAALPVAGALEWRPHSWITGASGAGKSTLLGKHGLVPIMLDKSLIVTADATEAGLRQMTSQKTLPILFEELEPDWQNSKAKAVIELARKASSGADIYRGGSDHNAAGFKAETSFVFSSILIPPMLTQDRGRLAILELDPLPDGAEPLRIDRREWQNVARAMTRRLIDQWGRFAATLALYRKALGARGHDARGQDQFGTLLALHDLLLYDIADASDDRYDAWAEHLDTKQLSEAIGRKTDDLEVLEHLKSSFVHSRGGDDRETVAQVVMHALDMSVDGTSRRSRARDRLMAIGMRVGTVTVNGEGKKGFKEEFFGDDVYVAVAGPGNVGLGQIFERTRWFQGGWTQSLARVPGSIPRVKVRFGGNADWAIAVPISAMVQLAEEANDDA